MEIVRKAKDRLASLKKQVRDQPRLFAHQADCYILLGKYKQAAKILNQGLEKFPNLATGWLVKGNLHLHLNQHKLAYSAFKQALKIDNNIVFAHERCVELSEERGDSKRYIHHLRELKKLDPIDDSIQGRLDTALLRQAAVEHGLYTEDRVVNISSKMLRRTLLEHNLIPPEIERKKERYFKTDEVVEQPPEEVQANMLDEAAEYASGYVSERSEPESAEELDSEETHESPLMKLLRGEMEEHPTPREVTFVTVDDAAGGKAQSDVSSQERVPGGTTVEAAAKARVKIDPEDLKRMEEDQLRLARIAREVTGPAVKTESDKAEPSPEVSGEAEAEIVPSWEEGVAEAQAPPEPGVQAEPVGEMEAETTDLPPVGEEKPDVSLPSEEKTAPPAGEGAEPSEPAAVEEAVVEPTGGTAAEQADEPKTRDDAVTASKGRVPTKTLAELYTSQGDIQNAVDVYEELLKKHPTNKAYRKRIDELKNQV